MDNAKIFLVVMLLLLLAGCTAQTSTTTPVEEQQILASQICPSIENSFFIPDWQVYAGLAILVSAAILGVLYMFHKFFGNETGQAQVKLEVFELFASVFLVFVVIIILDASCSIQIGSILSPEGFEHMNIFEAAAATLNDFSKDLIISTSLLHLVYIPFDYLTTITLTQHPMGMGTVLQPMAGAGAVWKPAHVQSIQMMAVAFVIIRAQLLLLDFGTFAMLTYYLPLGILLRMFTPTRKIGGTLIGLTLGLVLVYPALIILNGVVIFPMSPFSIDNWESFKDVVASAWPSWEEFSSSSLSILEPLSIFRALKLVVGGVFGTIMALYYSLALRTASVAFLIGIFFPALNTLLLVTAIRYLSKALGEEIDVSSLTRMI